MRVVLYTHLSCIIKPQGNKNRALLKEGRNIIGRDKTCDIVIQMTALKHLSRIHCAIQITGNNIELEDLGSSFGTTVNGTLVTSPVPIKVGDTIGLGGKHVNGELELTLENG